LELLLYDGYRSEVAGEKVVGCWCWKVWTWKGWVIYRSWELS